jgi:hypothetical protein
MRRRKYQRTLRRIAELEYALGLSDVRPPDSPKRAADRWARSASAKAINYTSTERP